MPGQRRYGMDHGYYDWSPIVSRAPLKWPNSARMALCVILVLEHFEWQPPEWSYEPPRGAASPGQRPYREFAHFSERDYGHRVGIFRVLDTLEAHGVKVTVAMDALTAKHYPFLVEHCLKRGCEIIAHGISASRMITSDMSEREERRYIQSSLHTLACLTGSPSQGWLGAEYGESLRTPRLLAELGVSYVCDWANDDQPYHMRTPDGELIALPTMFSLEDSNVLLERRVPIDIYSRMLMEAFDTLYEEASRIRRLLVLNLHPWLVGQPFRIGYLDEALAYMMGRENVWSATGSEIASWFAGKVGDAGDEC